MFQLLESLRIENGRLHHLELHNQRFNNARKQLFNIDKQVDLGQIIEIPHSLNSDRYKCRVTTNGETISSEITPYTQRDIKSVRLVHLNLIDYQYKTDQRDQLNYAFSLRGNCDDVIIVKNGFLTDSWVANILLFDGYKWYTPDTPLLKGIQREYLLQNNIVTERKIHYNTLCAYKKFKLVNALVDFERAYEIDISKICLNET